MKAFRLFVVCAWLTLSACAWSGQSVVRAEDDKSSVSTLTNENLQTFLTNLGYEAKKLGEGAYQITIEQDDWTFRIKVSLSGNKEKIWMSTFLGEIADPSKVPADVLVKLLAANHDIGPAHFYICNCKECKATVAKRLSLEKSLDNRNVSPTLIRKEMEKFCATIRETEDLWDIPKWTKGTKDGSAKKET
jgi:hypothetical protein